MKENKNNEVVKYLLENYLIYVIIIVTKRDWYNQSQISLLPWIGNFTQSFLHSHKIKLI